LKNDWKIIKKLNFGSFGHLMKITNGMQWTTTAQTVSQTAKTVENVSK
jgi:hypothetical protein